MNHTATLLALLALLTLLGGCASREAMNPADLEPGRLPPPDLTLNIPGLGPCTDSPDRSLRIDSSQPVHVLVHGCFGSSGQFRGLAQVLAFHGQQSACFTYDDRAKLTQGADELKQAVQQLAAQSRVPQITVIGHSQGALIARKAMTASSSLTPLPGRPVDLRLVTISGPFSGIAAAQTCGKSWLYPLSLGLVPLSCYIATGPKWADITFSSRFIREPGSLAPQVSRYLKIDTDERGSCRREEGGRCVESDVIFSLDEQRQTLIESDARTKRVEVNAGHVEIVGDKRVAPKKLIAILQEQGVLRATAPARLPAFSLLLSRVYQE
ncbi:esterase/lipase family protein [Polaromonas eurypsychrophila]|uniref:Hydrolase n=1 Tax=Polaromonas eurypsychrophila TaxID=1614635 RepID=A0A916WED2_9BURK|nr:alpha/beta hydrolase [Polaromonas eurypsychrophila]GGA90674.1 hydrolase [Polaromonas eurypsychrophila]